MPFFLGAEIPDNIAWIRPRQNTGEFAISVGGSCLYVDVICAKQIISAVLKANSGRIEGLVILRADVGPVFKAGAAEKVSGHLCFERGEVLWDSKQWCKLPTFKIVDCLGPKAYVEITSRSALEMEPATFDLYARRMEQVVSVVNELFDVEYHDVEGVPGNCFSTPISPPRVLRSGTYPGLSATSRVQLAQAERTILDAMLAADGVPSTDDTPGDVLDLAHLGVVSLPGPIIASISGLKIIRCQDNHVRDLPIELGAIPTLEEIECEGNPLEVGVPRTVDDVRARWTTYPAHKSAMKR